MERRREKVDGGIESDHGLGHGLAGRVEIKAAAQAAVRISHFSEVIGISEKFRVGCEGEGWLGGGFRG